MHGFVCCVVNERLQLIDDAINGSVCSSIVAELVADIQLYNNATDDILLSPETSTSDSSAAVACAASRAGREPVY